MPEMKLKNAEQDSEGSPDRGGAPSWCTHYLAGDCRYGDGCHFRHYPGVDPAPRAPARAAAAPQESDSVGSNGSRERERAPRAVAEARAPADCRTTLCPYALAGTCNWGDRCRYVHSAVRPATVATAVPAREGDSVGSNRSDGSRGSARTGDRPEPPRGRNTKVCLKFLEGICLRGDTCWYSHDSTARPVTRPKPAPAPAAQSRTPATALSEAEELQALKDRIAQIELAQRAHATAEENQALKAMLATVMEGRRQPPAPPRPAKSAAELRTEAAQEESKRLRAAMQGMSVGNTPATPRAAPAPALAPRKKCSDFIEGSCPWGDACRLLHSHRDRMEYQLAAEQRELQEMEKALLEAKKESSSASAAPRVNRSSPILVPIVTLRGLNRDTPLRGPLKGRHINWDCKERHLSDEEFQATFGMGRELFEALQQWKKIQLRTDAGLL